MFMFDPSLVDGSVDGDDEDGEAGGEFDFSTLGHDEDGDEREEQVQVRVNILTLLLVAGGWLG